MSHTSSLSIHSSLSHYSSCETRRWIRCWMTVTTTFCEVCPLTTYHFLTPKIQGPHQYYLYAVKYKLKQPLLILILPANECSSFHYYYPGLLSGNDMSPGRKSFRESNKRQVGNSEVGISEYGLLNQGRSKAA